MHRGRFLGKFSGFFSGFFQNFRKFPEIFQNCQKFPEISGKMSGIFREKSLHTNGNPPNLGSLFEVNFRDFFQKIWKFSRNFPEIFQKFYKIVRNFRKFSGKNVRNFLGKTPRVHTGICQIWETFWGKFSGLFPENLEIFQKFSRNFPDFSGVKIDHFSKM